jgi:class 3 adenylate cyclase
LAALDITRSVQSLLRVSLRLGIATGVSFCGNVGSNLRCEYVLIGSSVNRAARLMNVACSTGSFIVCDHPTMLASTSIPTVVVRFYSARLCGVFVVTLISI